MQKAILSFWSHTPRRSRRTRNVSLNSRTAQSCAIMHSQRRRALWSLEHFSVDWPKERARRQYAQYGEREATQGKSLKNALNPRKMRRRRLLAAHPRALRVSRKPSKWPPADFSNNVGHHHRHYFGRLHRRAGLGDETEDTGDHSRTGPQYPFYLSRPRPRRAPLARQ